MGEYADIIVKVGCHMIARFGDDAVRRAQLRAQSLTAVEPVAAARWHLVAQTIEMIGSDSKKVLL